MHSHTSRHTGTPWYIHTSDTHEWTNPGAEEHPGTLPYIHTPEHAEAHAHTTGNTQAHPHTRCTWTNPGTPAHTQVHPHTRARTNILCQLQTPRHIPNTHPGILAHPSTSTHKWTHPGTLVHSYTSGTCSYIRVHSDTREHRLETRRYTRAHPGTPGRPSSCLCVLALTLRETTAHRHSSERHETTSRCVFALFDINYISRQAQPRRDV